MLTGMTQIVGEEVRKRYVSATVSSIVYVGRPISLTADEIKLLQKEGEN